MSKQAQANHDEQTILEDLVSLQDPAAMQKLSANMTQAMLESQQLITSILGHGPENLVDAKEHPIRIGAGTAFSKVGQSLANNPERVVDANLSLWQGYLQLWQQMMSGTSEGSSNRDKRFADPEWQSNPMFEFMRRSYSLNTGWLLSLIENAEGLSQQDKRKAKFLAQQTADAFAPTNFFATNPAALKAMLETGGESVLKGIRQARQDIERGRGKLTISQTDETPFEVGVNVATAPGKVVYRNALIEVIQYSPTTETVHEIPLVIFPPWINKFYILDLREENSMIRWLVDKGLTVFVVSWRSAEEDIKDFGWDEYIAHGVFEGLAAALEESGADQVNAVGYCIGGTLLTSALGYMAKKGYNRIRSATFFASQSDFTDGGDLMVFTDEDAISEISLLIEENNGIMPGEIMGETFNWLRPVDLVWRYVVDNYMMGKKPRPFDLLYWNADQTNIPGPTHLTYLNDMYRENALSKGTFKVLGETVSMSEITIPVTVQASRDDHICPYSSVYRTAKAFGGDTRFVLAGSGHIAGVINHPDAMKYQHWLNDGELPASADEWMRYAEELPGSWWTSWWDWLEPLSGAHRPARVPADKQLGDAPGAYVKARLSALRKARAKGETLAPAPSTEVKLEPKPKARKASAAKKPATPRKSAPKAAAEAAGKSSKTTTKPKTTKKRGTRKKTSGDAAA
ncbi:MAG: class I poly(R)-hydroxyalkanoic acid synthase [Pseudomonadota bacterium]